MTGRRIVLWRHGRTNWNLERRFQGQADIALDAEGMEQARRSAEVLARVDPHMIVSSDLLRAAQTARALASLVGLEVRTDVRLRETYAGEWEGLDRFELMSRFGPEFERWAADSYVRAGGGETRVEVASRVVAAIHEFVDMLPTSGTLIVATHGGAARAAIGALLELPAENWACLGVLSNCAWSILSENESLLGPRWRLQEYNAGSLPTLALADDR